MAARMFPPMGMGSKVMPKPFGQAPKKPGFMPMGTSRKMMADGGMNAPAAIGGPMAPPPSNPADPDNDGDVDMPMIKPESVNYHDDAQSCSGCQYMSEDGQCAVLKMQVNPEGACNAFESKGGTEETYGEEPGEDDGNTEDGTSGMPRR